VGRLGRTIAAVTVGLAAAGACTAGDDGAAAPTTTTEAATTTTVAPPAPFATPEDLAVALGCVDTYEDGNLQTEGPFDEHRAATGSCWWGDEGKVILDVYASADDQADGEQQQRGDACRLARRFGFTSLHHAAGDRWWATGDADVDGAVADALAAALDGDPVHLDC
jgi:hypothetical protein